MKIIGSYVSPYVRKVTACLALKGLDYEIDPITPFYGDERFGRLSPLRRIPVLIDEDLVLTDSSVICAWLDEAYAGHPLLPAAPADRARARWLEEYADSRLGDIFIWGLFYQKRVHPAVWGEPGDADRIDKTLTEDAPAALDYLEEELPDAGWLFGEIGLADIAIASFFRNAAYADFTIDSARWPRTAEFVARARPSLLRRHLPVRAGAALDQSRRPPPGPARRGRTAHGRIARHAPAAQGGHDALNGSPAALPR
jgi:glutathione S-transferase